MRQFVVLILLSFTFAGCGKDDATGTDAGNTSDASTASDTGSSADTGGTTDTGSTTEDAGATDDTGNSSDMGTGGDDTGGNDDMGGGGDDMGAADMGSTDDMGAVDMGPPGPCAPGYTAHEEVAGAVVACEGAADSLNQCDAEDACGAGWHMCTATEYRQHFEAVEPAAANDASYWIASCIRDGAAPTSPSDVVCQDCTGTQTGSTEAVSYSCVNALTLDTDQTYVGVRAGTACTFAGLDQAGNDAFWNAQPSSALQAGAFCCVD